VGQTGVVNFAWVSIVVCFVLRWSIPVTLGLCAFWPGGF
jgi:hypothetical protein